MARVEEPAYWFMLMRISDFAELKWQRNDNGILEHSGMA